MDQLFNSTEFYVFSLLVAIVIAGYFFRPRLSRETKSFFAKGAVVDCDDDEKEQLVISSNDYDSLVVVHTGVPMHDGGEGSLQAVVDVDGRHIFFMEKTFPVLSDTPSQRKKIVYVFGQRMSVGRTRVVFASENSDVIGTDTIDITPPMRTIISLSR